MKSRISNYLVVDCETGGLPSKTKDPVYDIALTEIALVLVNSELNIVAKDSFYIKPYPAIYDSKALEITGLTKEKLKENGISIVSAAERITTFLKENDFGKNKPTLVGQNIINFDLAFFENLFTLCSDDLYKHFNTKVFDTLDFAHLKYNELNNYKLPTLCTKMDIELVNAHSALPDTIATAELWISYLKLLRSDGVNDVANDVVKELESITFNY